MSRIDRRVLLGAASVAGVAVISRLTRTAQAGPLEPPAGPVASSGRTLDEIYNKVPGANGSGDGRIAIPGGTNVVTITQPGSYVLMGDIAVALIKGIVISASNVTLDLNGYTVSATNFGPGASLGISSNQSDIVVRNGTFRGNTNGVDISAGVNRLVLEDLRFSGVSTNGIRTVGTTCRNITIRRCIFEDFGSGANGILLAGACLRVEECTLARFNSSSSDGIVIDTGSVGVLVAGNTVMTETPIARNGIVFRSGVVGVYRDNTVVNFTNPYTSISGTDGGGNV